VCATHEVTDCRMCTVYNGTGGETSEGILPVTTQPDTDAPPTPPTTEGFIRWVAGFDIGLPVENEDAAVFDYYRAIVRKARDHTRTLDPTPSDAPQEGRPTDDEVWQRLEAEPGFNEELEQARADIEAGRGVPFRAVREGRPTTPQTEAPSLDREQWDEFGNPAGSFDEVLAMADRNQQRLIRDNQWCFVHNEPRAAAGALPSVEAPLTCECGKPLALSHIAWDPNYTPHTPRARLAAAPPEASER
jgi:hypothetical protein